jgi:hypothetical protein
MSRYTAGEWVYVLDDTANNDAHLPFPSKLQFAIEYEYAPATRGDHTTPGEAADINVLSVTLKWLAPWYEAVQSQAGYRPPTVKEQATAELWLANRLRKDNATSRDLRERLLEVEERTY